MQGVVAPLMILLLALLHAPNQAQALLFDFLPANWVALGSSEPVTLLLTGLALFSLGRVSLTSARGPARHHAPAPRTRRPRSEVGVDSVAAVTKRAA